MAYYDRNDGEHAGNGTLERNHGPTYALLNKLLSPLILCLPRAIPGYNTFGFASMRCEYCGRKIGLLRLALDRRFCSRDHRKKKLLSSARALRDATGFYGYVDPELDEPWLTEKESAIRPQARPSSQDTAAALMGLVILGTFLVAWPNIPSGSSNNSGGGGNIATAPGRLVDSVRSAISPPQRIRLNDDFTAGLGAWEGFKGVSDWTVERGSVHPGRLRLWKPSLQLADYEMNFASSIEKKSVSWAFRAGDLKNYYATKISLSAKSGGQSAAEIIRFAVLNGQEGKRVRMPLPMPLRTDTLYQIALRVKGDHYTTSVNGQIVDTWIDGRLRAGGVGFFADKGEAAAIHAVQLSELREPGFFSRLLAMGMIMGPMAAPYELGGPER
jgi:hypothetical protein